MLACSLIHSGILVSPGRTSAVVVVACALDSVGDMTVLIICVHGSTEEVNKKEKIPVICRSAPRLEVVHLSISHCVLGCRLAAC